MIENFDGHMIFEIAKKQGGKVFKNYLKTTQLNKKDDKIFKFAKQYYNLYIFNKKPKVNQETFNNLINNFGKNVEVIFFSDAQAKRETGILIDVSKAGVEIKDEEHIYTIPFLKSYIGIGSINLVGGDSIYTNPSVFYSSNDYFTKILETFGKKDALCYLNKIVQDQAKFNIDNKYEIEFHR